jgi:type 1 fimbria pilin
MSMAQAFADIGLGFSAVLGVGFHDAVAKWPGTATYDDGGSITASGTPVEKPCSVQVDSTTEAMRSADGYTDLDMRLLVLSATLDADLDTSARIEVLDGPHAGTWQLASCDRDPAGIYWECRGRRA